MGYWDRLSEAAGHVSMRLPVKPDRSPMIIHDFVGGRTFRITYLPPRVVQNLGTVYLLEDGFAIKIGFTYGPVAKRIGELQTGNPRRITTIAELPNAPIELEYELQSKLNEWNVSGERGPLVRKQPKSACSPGGCGSSLRM